MTKEELLALGLTEEQVPGVFKINGIDVEKAKGDLATKETELISTKEQLKTANTEIQSYKSMDIEAIKKASDDYKAKFEAAETKAKEELDALKFNHAIENALIKAGAKNVKAAKALLDGDSLKGSKNLETDIAAAITKAKEADPYLYGETDPNGTGGSLGGGAKPPKTAITKEDFAKMGYKEKVDLYNKQPEVYKTLKG